MIELCAMVAMGVFVGVLVGLRVGSSLCRSRLDSMKRHVEEIEGYYREYQLASYKNAARLEAVLLMAEEFWHGVDGPPYRTMAPSREWFESLERACQSHGYVVDGPYRDPLRAAAVTDDDKEASHPMIFPLGHAYWAVRERLR